MSELMTLKEAYEKAGAKDFLRRTGWCGDGFKREYLEDDSKDVLTLQDALCSDWHIIPAELKVLSTSEYMDIALVEPGKWQNGDIAQAFIQGKKNGRLEMWLEFKEYLSDKKYKEPDMTLTYPASLTRAIQALKP